MTFVLLKRGLKISGLFGAVAGSAYFLQQNVWEVSTLGIFRFGRAGFAALQIVADYKVTLWNVDPNSEDYQKIKSKIHTRSAERLRDVCLDNGGVFIKVGQHIGSLDYLLPPEYVQTMRILYDKVPLTPVKKMLEVFKEEFGQEPDEVFSSIDPKPLGSASLAQVHKAVLKDGTPVAVKIQYPRVKAHSFVDIKTMTLLVKAVKFIFPGFKYMWLAEETEKNLPLELDFIQEGKNCEKVAKMLQHLSFFKVPCIYWNLSSSRVLTMEYCTGGHIDDKEYMTKSKIPVNEVSKKMSKIFSEMIFKYGYVHCDPHPGNMLVNKTKKGETTLTLLDHGLYQILTDEFRLNYCQLWMSLIKADLKSIKHYAHKMNCGELYGLFACILTARSWSSILSGIDKTPISQDEAQEIQNQALNYVVEISEVLERIPRQMLLILKTNDVLRGIEAKLKVTKNAESFLNMSRYCINAIAKEELLFCDTLTCKLQTQFYFKMLLFKISMLEFFLWLTSTSIGRYVWKILDTAKYLWFSSTLIGRFLGL